MDELEELINSLTNHSPGNEQIIRITRIRQAAREFAKVLVDSTPKGRCKSIAKTKFEESVMWAVKGVVLASESDSPPPPYAK